MTPTIPVHVQTPEQPSVFFAQWPMDDLDSVLNLLRRWGLTDSSGDDLDAAGNAVGEFVVTSSQVIFRVSVYPS